MPIIPSVTMKPTNAARLLQIAACISIASSSERLLKVPKIYNALITSNEELLPSQAYPAVAPVIQPGPGSFYVSGPPVEYRETGPEPAEPILEGPPPTGLPELPASPSSIKNYQPINPNIPDVPPPPLPMRVGPKRLSSG